MSSCISCRQILAMVCGMLPLATVAQTSSIPSLDSVVVTPARAAQLESEVVGDVTVIGKEELERAGQTSIAEVLSRQPGIQFFNMGGPQTQTSVFMRGTNAAHTLVLIDGVRANVPASGGANWNAIDPNLIDRIEIVRGAASSLYGSDAIGGVVNIITKKGGGDRPLSAWGNVGYGSYDTFKSSAGLSGAQNGWDYAFSASMAHSSGFNATRSDNGDYHPDRDGYEQHGVSGSLGYTFRPGHHLGLSIYNNYLNGQYDIGPYVDDARTLTRQQGYAITSTNQITSQWESVLRFGLAKDSSEDRSFSTSHINVLQRSWSWQNNFDLNANHRISTVLERVEERLQSSEHFDHDKRNTNSAGLIYQGRFDRLRTQASVRNDKTSQYGSKTTGSLGLDVDLTDHWSVGVAGNTGFRAPTFNDLYGPWGGNPELKPETSRNVEANVSYRTDTTQLRVAAYQNRIRDMIAFQGTLPYNVARARIRGVSVAASHRFGNTTIRANADFMTPRDEVEKQPLMRRAKQTFGLAVNHRINAWDLGAEYQYIGKRYDMSFDPVTYAAQRVRLKAYSLVNLTAAYDFSKSVGVQLRWNNVFDKDYTNAWGYAMPGSNVFVNLSFRM